MTNSELEDRCLAFSIDVVNYVKASKMHKAIADQLLRSATSVGANYTEANNASSKKDFRNKIYIAKKEASETRYWLKVIKNTEPKNEQVDQLIDEISQLILIFQKIVNTLNTKRQVEK
jgi:four helix bundle protein